MPIYFVKRILTSKGRVWVASCLLIIVLGQAGCTRDEVAAAISTVAVQLEATLEPWGATAVANAQSLETRVPAALATAKAPAARAVVTPSHHTDDSPVSALIRVETATQTVVPIHADVAPPTPLPTNTATPTSSPTPTDTVTPTPTFTPTPTATPYPEIVEVAGGSMTLIPGGFFQMGAAAESLNKECTLFRDGCQADWFSASEPVHTILLGRYYIDIHEVTNEAYAAFLNEAGANCGGEPCIDSEHSQITLAGNTYSADSNIALLPAAGVTWYGAAAYCEWREARLPSEAEWEKAAAWDDENSLSRQYPWGDEFDGHWLNFCDASCEEQQANSEFNDGYAKAAPVASFMEGQSAAGLFDMAGNVWEWVADWYDPTYYTNSPESDPQGPDQGDQKVVRGGSWFDTGNFTASAIRFPSVPDNADRTIGFRCAADLP